MPKMTVRNVSMMVRDYFDEIKKTKFIFDIISVDFNGDEEEWRVWCEVSNVFDEEARCYLVIVDDTSDKIVDISEQKIEKGEEGRSLTHERMYRSLVKS